MTETRNTPKYNIIRKHSGDTNTSIVERVATKAEARKFIKAEIAELEATPSTPHKITSLGDVTNIKFSGYGLEWSIGYWYEKA